MTQANPSVQLHRGDLPPGLDFGDSVAVDTETMGLKLSRDRLCLAQLSAGDGICHLVQFEPGRYDAPNLVAVLTDPSVTKLFHFARFDMAMLRRHMGIACAPVYCTKIASRLARTYASSHGLKDLCRELLGIDLAKEQQSSDWGDPTLTEAQMTYAAQDVLHLHALRRHLDEILAREGRTELADACFRFLQWRVDLDLGGWDEDDIFAH